MIPNAMTRPWRLVAALVAVATLGAAATSPTAAMRATVDQVIATLKAPALDHAVRRQRVVAAVRDRFDFRTMAQRTLATNWRKASPAQRDAFVDRFTKLLEETYLARIDTYHNETVLYDAEKIQRDRALVKTHIHTTSVDIPIDYRLHQVDGEWQVYDVVIEAVSLVRNYRTTFREIAHKRGIDGLLKEMDAKIRELREAGTAGTKGEAG